MSRKVVLVPGLVNNWADGKPQGVTGHRLAQLYKIPLSMCIIWDPLGNQARPDPSLPHLYPDATGEYKLPEEVAKIVEEHLREG